MRDYLHYPYSSRRNVVFARNGMVATAQPLAAQAGLTMFQKGGNAVDAAVAAAACLTVVEPTSNGIGGDAFALIWCGDKLFGLNASGPAPMSISLEALKKRGCQEMPRFGFDPVTVPGAPAAWAECSRRFGRLPFSELLQPAVAYAGKGYPVSPELSLNWQRAVESYSQELRGEQFVEWFRVFAPGGTAPAPGTVWSSPDHARTLQSIAETGAESFYRGEIAGAIDRFSRDWGGYIRFSDLAVFTPRWVEPIRAAYRGYDIWELPPNGQGLVALQALKILDGFNFPGFDDPEALHRQIEAVKLAFADGMAVITDPEKITITAEIMLDPGYITKRRSLIGEHASIPSPGRRFKGGTVYLAAADGEGNMVSFIQSNYMGFGSGLVVPGTGVALQNRGCNFSLDPAHVNCLAPGKRPYHTIIPGFLTKEGRPVGPFGVMGAFMQPQGHVQILINTLDYYLNPQAALDAPRWQWLEGKTVAVEENFPVAAAAALERRGHTIVVAPAGVLFGRGQIIWRDPDTGVLVGGTEPRSDGMVAAW